MILDWSPGKGWAQVSELIHPREQQVTLSQPGRSIPSTGAVGQPLMSQSWGCSQWRTPKPRLCSAAAAPGVPGSSLVIPDSKMGKHRESPCRCFQGILVPLSNGQGLRDSWLQGHLHIPTQNPTSKGAATAHRHGRGCSTSPRIPKPSLSGCGTWGAVGPGKPPGPSTPNNYPFSQCQLTIPTQVMANQESSQPVVPNSDHLTSSNPVSCFPRYFLTHPQLHLCLVAVPALGGDRGLHTGSRQDKAEGEWGS